MKYLVRDRFFGIGEDFWITDQDGERAFLVDGKALRLRQTFELRDPEREIVATIRKKVFSFRSTMVIELGDSSTTTVHKKLFGLFRHHFVADVADGGKWKIEGDFLNKEYTIAAGDEPVAAISHRWFSLRDTYAVDILGNHDPALVLCVAVSVDRLAEGKED